MWAVFRHSAKQQNKADDQSCLRTRVMLMPSVVNCGYYCTPFETGREGGLIAKINTDRHKYYCKTLITNEWVTELVSALSTLQTRRVRNSNAVLN
jgi:hypothetical protein